MPLQNVRFIVDAEPIIKTSCNRSTCGPNTWICNMGDHYNNILYLQVTRNGPYYVETNMDLLNLLWVLSELYIQMCEVNRKLENTCI